MFNIDKIRFLCKQKGIRIGYLSEQLGLKNSYLSDVSRGKNSISDERIRKIADLLGTTYEYLTDQTDDPLPPRENIIAKAESPDEQLVLKLMGKLPEVTDEERDTLDRLFSLTGQDFSHCLEVIRVMLKRK